MMGVHAVRLEKLARSSLFLLLIVLLTGCAEQVPASTMPSTRVTRVDASLTPGMTWQWQLTGPIDTSVEANLYDLDLFDSPQGTMDELHAAGRMVACCFSAGSREDWRQDALAYPEEILGRELEGWEGERWLDIRRLDLLSPLLEARLDLAVAMGCDGVEPDNVDGYANDTGFPLTYEDQLAFNIWLAEEAHARGLFILLKNDLEQVGDLLPYFDGALNEQCFQYDECELLLPFIEAGLPVLGVEYELAVDDFCPQANAWGFSWMRKRSELDAWAQPCWGASYP